MLALWLHVAAISSIPQAEPSFRLELRGSSFFVSEGRRSYRVPVAPPPEAKTPNAWPPNRLLFRRDGAYAVWDARGLSVRQKSWVFTSRLVEIPTSPKIFSREEILQTKEKIDSGQRTLEASGLSGAYRDGADVFFLVRWDEAGGKPWMEALVKVDLTEEKPKPKLLGRFAGLSMELEPGKSRLFVRESKPSAWIKIPESWGLAKFEPETTVFDYKPIGGPPERVHLGEKRTGWFVEQTSHPSKILYRWDKQTLSTRPLVETRGTVRLLDSDEPWIAVLHEEEGSFLQNLETGARFLLPERPAFRRTERGVLVWSPAQRPETALLLDPQRWTRLARWSNSRPPLTAR